VMMDLVGRQSLWNVSLHFLFIFLILCTLIFDAYWVKLWTMLAGK
jgi:hypothetical protein